MKVTFLGVGEACDERMPNTSLWVRTGEGVRAEIGDDGLRLYRSVTLLAAAE